MLVPYNASHKQRSKLDAFLRRVFLQKTGLLAESGLMRLLGAIIINVITTMMARFAREPQFIWA